MKTTLLVIFIFLFACLIGCGDDNTITNNNNGNSHFIGRYAAIIEQPGGGTPIDSIIFNIYGNGNISTFSITIMDNNNNPIVATITGNISNDTVVNFTSNMNYLNTTFTNVITGSMIDSNNYHYLFGKIKLLNAIIGYFNYYFPVTPDTYGSFNTPALNLWFRIRKLS